MPRLRRPCQPAITVLALRLASTRQSGTRAARCLARERASLPDVGLTICPMDATRYASLSLCLPAQSGDDVAHRHALGTGGEGQGHAVLENGLGECVDIVERGCQTAVVERTSAGAEHHRLAGARAGAPGDMLVGGGIALARAG